MRTTFLIIALALNVLGGCTSPQQQPGSKIESTITFEKMAGLKMGVAKSGEVATYFGAPDQALTQEDKTVVWIYRDPKNGSEKAIVTFSADGLLIDKYLAIGVNEADQDLTVVVKRFEGGFFKKETSIADFGHFFNTNTTFVDKNLGISIAVRGDGKSVSSIHWYDAKTRALAKTKSPESVIYRDPASGLVTKVPSTISTY